MRGLKADLARALHLAEKADVGKEGKSKMFSLFRLIFSSIPFSCTDSRGKRSIPSALVNGAQHASQTKSIEH